MQGGGYKFRIQIKTEKIEELIKENVLIQKLKIIMFIRCKFGGPEFKII